LLKHERPWSEILPTFYNLIIGMYRLLFTAFICLISLSAFAQCDDVTPIIESPRLDSIVHGAILLCNNDDTEFLSTETYDSYQWYRQRFSTTTPNPNSWEPIDTATGQVFEITSTYFLENIKVEVTLDTCVYESPSIRLDGYIYGFPLMETKLNEGTFEQAGPAEFNICQGATVQFSNTSPGVWGDMTWFNCLPSSIPPGANEPCIIDGINGDTLVVGESGIYSFYTCTNYCPDQCQYLGVSTKLNFGDWDFCETTSVGDNPTIELLTVYPNPAQDFVRFDGVPTSPLQFEIHIYDVAGKVVSAFDGFSLLESIDVSSLAPGMYTIIATSENTNEQFKGKIVKK
jgi:hypothetical protein